MEDNNWFNKSVEETVKQLDTNIENGLTQKEVEKLQEEKGFNELKEGKKKSIIIKFLEQFKDFMIIVLIIAAIISGVVNQINGEGMTDTFIIMIVIIANAIIGVVQENRAEKSLEALKKLSSHSAKVIRGGTQVVLPSRELVVGDIVVLDTGDYVPADLRIIESVNLQTQESALTGESTSVEKISEIINDEKIGLGDMKNIAFSSSLVTYGRGKGIVVAVGMDTEVGKIATMIESTEKEKTPLQAKLDNLGKTLGIAALAICLVIFVVGWLYGRNPLDMFMTAVGLAVAAIPEGLVAVSTIVLAIGVQRMVKENAIVKKLPAVETLGSTSVICSDKTGTLTQNKMTVKKICWNNQVSNVEGIDTIKMRNENLNLYLGLRKLIYTSLLCNDTKVGEKNKLIGDPTETALVDMGFKLDFDPSRYGTYPRVYEVPFDSDRKLMTTVNKEGDFYYVDTKGGIDELLKRCNSYIIDNEVKKIDDEFLKQVATFNEDMAKDALRVLAMAYKKFDHEPTEKEMENIESDLTFIGMVGMIDPPREEVKDAIKKCKTAGIKTVMITGDHVTTAVAIAKELGILEDEKEAITGSELEEMSDEELKKNVESYSVYARVSPEHKVRIVKAWQSHNQIVAMTGDGVNDAPALKTANIGCAMGITGTDVSKEAADVILTDDNFATIVKSVEEGRRIYDNILKAIQFLISSNLSEILVLFVATLVMPLLSQKLGIDVNNIEIFTVVQLLWINLITDSLPALALSVDPANKDIMERQPNKSKGIFTKGMVWRMTYQGIVIGIVVLAAFLIGLFAKDEIIQNTATKYPNLTVDEVRIEIAQTMAFIVIAFAELVHIFNIRNNKKSIFKTGIGGNKILFLALAFTSCLMIAVLTIPALQNIFGIITLPTELILECVGLVLVPVVIVELMKLFKINASKDE
ncbi:MAG: cation-translocating P-type ATPase [Clostridia bacterium]|nr:cation-translocating P-type ATPase [Clostridia bacterium]